MHQTVSLFQIDLANSSSSTPSHGPRQNQHQSNPSPALGTSTRSGLSAAGIIFATPPPSTHCMRRAHVSPWKREVDLCRACIGWVCWVGFVWFVLPVRRAENNTHPSQCQHMSRKMWRWRTQGLSPVPSPNKKIPTPSPLARGTRGEDLRVRHLVGLKCRLLETFHTPGGGTRGGIPPCSKVFFLCKTKAG